MALAQPATESLFVKGLQQEARKNELEINVGIHEPSERDKGKVKNTLIWIDIRGNIVQRYQKLHLFDVDVAGGPQIRESDSVEKGREIVLPFETNVGRVGMAICFDVHLSFLSSSSFLSPLSTRNPSASTPQ